MMLRLFTLALLFIVTTSAFSVFNLFTDLRFSKDDFQRLVPQVKLYSEKDFNMVIHI